MAALPQLLLVLVVVFAVNVENVNAFSCWTTIADLSICPDVTTCRQSRCRTEAPVALAGDTVFFASNNEDLRQDITLAHLMNFPVNLQPVAFEKMQRECIRPTQIPSYTLLFHAADFYNLFHTLFDIIVPVFDTILADKNGRFDPADVQLGLFHNYRLTCSHLPENDRECYRFLPLLTAFTDHELIWILDKPAKDWTNPPAHEQQADRQMHILKPALIADLQHLICLNSSVFMNLDTRLILWPHSSDFDEPFAVTRFPWLSSVNRLPEHAPHYERFETLFQHWFPKRFGFIDDLDIIGPAKLQISVVVRNKNSRPSRALNKTLEILQIVTRSASSVVNIDVIDWAKMSLSDQMRQAFRTNVLIADHGAGMSHMVFMAKGGSVVELSQPMVVDLDYFQVLASIMKLRYIKCRDMSISASILQRAMFGLLPS